MSHGPGVYPDMSQAVVSTGVYSSALKLLHQLLQRSCLNESSFDKLTMSDTCTYFINRFLETHQCCRGSGGPCSAQLQLRGQESPWGSGPVRCVLRSNRCEPGARQLACWWWSSLFSPCVTCRSACSMSWKGKITSNGSRIKSHSNTDAAYYEFLLYIRSSPW